MSTTSNKTKDWLKNQLVTHGVPLPAASAKKEEYQRLYEEQVLPQQSNAEFSSDDDTEPVTPSPQPRANSVAKNTKKSDGEPTVDKRTAWVQGMSDQNLFYALSANERNPGPIVDSTRDLYRKMLLDILEEDEHKALSNIEQYLSENKEAREHWLESGLDLHGFNGVTNGNGNAENGFSDTDDDEAIETASRASRSSRASSIRATPTPVKQQTDSLPSTPKSPFDSKPMRARPSSSLRGGLNFNTSGLELHESEVTASSSRTETFLYNRVTSPGRTPYKPLLSSTRHGILNEDDNEESDEPDVAVSRKANAPRKSSKLVLQCLLILVSIIIVPVAIYLFFNQNKSNNCQDNGVDCPDELDVILKSLDDGVQDSGN